MVLQIFSRARQMMHARNAVLGKRGGIADACKHEELRRLERPGSQDHLAAGAQHLLLLALGVFDADGALALEDDARSLRLRLDAQIRPALHMRMDIAARRAPALAIVLRHLVDA